MGLRMSKEALNRNIDPTGLDADMAIEDHQWAVSAFMEKRTPDYEGRQPLMS